MRGRVVGCVHAAGQAGHALVAHVVQQGAQGELGAAEHRAPGPRYRPHLGHRARRQKARERSRLEDVEGIGPGRRAALLKHFGGLQGVSQAGVEELMQVRGISRELAERIYRTLNEPN